MEWICYSILVDTTNSPFYMFLSQKKTTCDELKKVKAISTKKAPFILAPHPPAGQQLVTSQEVVVQSKPQPTRQSLSYRSPPATSNYNTDQLMKAFQTFLTDYPRRHSPRNIYQNPPNHYWCQVPMMSFLTWLMSNGLYRQWWLLCNRSYVWLLQPFNNLSS